MKKLGLLVMPLMALSLLASCRGGDDPGPTPVKTTYTFTFNCKDCEAFDENDKKVTSVTVPVVESERPIYQEFYFVGNQPFKVPLKSNISIKKTGTEQMVEYKYINGRVYIPIVGDLTINAIGSSYSKDLETSSWAEIAEIAATGRANEFFSVGNEKTITLLENKAPQSFSHTVRIVDFNHDDLADGSGKAGITFEFKNLITNNNKVACGTKWNSSADNYDYRISTINGFLNDETIDGSIINMLPSGDIENPDLKEVIKPVNKLVGVKSKEKGKYEATSFDVGTYPKLFALAYNEMHDSDSKAVTPDETNGIYAYYNGHGGEETEDKSYRIKYLAGGGADTYWLRSPCTDYEDAAWFLTAWGNITFGGVDSGSHAVAPAFCI